MRRYRDFVTRVVCCYSTETESEAGDEGRDQELIELLPAEGPASARSRDAPRRGVPSRGQLRGAASSSLGGPDASDQYRDTSSDEDEDESRSSAMMRPAAGHGQAAGADTSPVRAAYGSTCWSHAENASRRRPQAQRIVRRLHERPQRRSRALALALSDAPNTHPATGGAPAAQTALSAAALGGDSQTLMVPLYAPGAAD